LPVLCRRRAASVCRKVWAKTLSAEIDIIGPECAVPLGAPLRGLKAIRQAVDEWMEENRATKEREMS
jgi:hypothetical protein